MSEYKYRKIDAFTSRESFGNPAACLYLDGNQSLSEEQMQSIAFQHKGFVSEVVFCSPSPKGGFTLTYFSSECEVDFCGHGTVACMYSLIRSERPLMKEKEIRIHTHRKGTLTVYNEIAEQDAVFITAPDAQFKGTALTGDVIAENLGMNADSISGALPVDLINAGLSTLIVPVRTLADEVNVFPDEKKLKHFCISNGIDIILIFSEEVSGAGMFAHTRVFAPKFGYLEDPATGSGNSAFANYLLKNRMWDGRPISIEQGGSNIAFNTVKLMTKDDKVLFGGRAADRIVGAYIL